MSGKIPLTILVILVIVSPSFGGVTVEQMKESINMVRKICQPKNKISDEAAEGLGLQKFPDEKPVKCYTHCVMEMMGIMKKTKLNYDAAIKQIDMMMPDDMKEPNKKALTMCKDSINGVKDPCEAAYTLLQCIFKNNPDFVF